MQSTLRSLLFLSFLSGAALYLCPEGGVRRILRILCTALLAAAVLEPLADFDYELFSLEQARFAAAAAEIGRKAESNGQILKNLLLQENCERYIETQGQNLGLAIKSAEAELREAEDGQCLPYGVTIRYAGDKTAAERLSRLIRDELGIPAERQVWSLNE